MRLTLHAHPLLELEALVSTLPGPLGAAPSPASLVARLSLDHEAPLAPDDQVKPAVRDLLRHGGFKPSGRSKPASEYLVRAGGEGKLRSINAIVDACNAASLHSGLPMSVVDLGRTVGALHVAVAAAGTSYVFNPSGQVIDVSGLLCLFDEEGPCANAVKDAQRTKTHDGTTRVMTVVWGTHTLPGRAARTMRWYGELLTEAVAGTEHLEVERVTQPD